MSDRLDGRHALVTGAASGIGLECARVLARAGARVTLVDIAEEAVARHAADIGGQAQGLTADVTAGVVVALGGFSVLTERWPQVEAGRPPVLAAVALGLGWVVYAETRFTGRLALTGGGLRYGGDWYPWSEIRGVRRSGERAGGVHLRLEPERLPRTVVGGRDLAVPDERLIAAIEAFRTTPEALAVGLPVTPPEPAPGVAER